MTSTDEVIAEVDLTQSEFNTFSKLASDSNQSFEEFINDSIKKYLDDLSGRSEENCGL